LGRRLSSVDPDLGTWNATYDAAGRLLTQTDAKAQVTTLTYDTMSCALSKTVSGAGLSTETTTNTYDQARAGFFNVGALTTTTRTVPLNGANAAVNNSKQFNYDLAGRLAQQAHLAVNGANKTLNTEYWPDGSVKRKQSADGVWSGQYNYDFRGLLYSIDNATATSATQPDLYLSSVLYNARGQATTMAYGNGHTTTNTYNDQRGWLMRVLSQQGATTLLDETYARDNRGQMSSITSTVLGRSCVKRGRSV
jgi:YD repeat-containing protein